MNPTAKELLQKASKTFQLLNPDIFPPTLDKNVTAENLERISLQYEAYLNPQIQDSEQSEQPEALASRGKRKAQGPRCPVVGFTLFRVKLLDWEAKYGSVKDLLDSLRYAGLLEGDREDQIDPKSFVRQVKVAHYAQEKTVIEIEYP